VSPKGRRSGVAPVGRRHVYERTIFSGRESYINLGGCFWCFIEGIVEGRIFVEATLTKGLKTSRALSPLSKEAREKESAELLFRCQFPCLWSFGKGAVYPGGERLCDIGSGVVNAGQQRGGRRRLRQEKSIEPPER